MCACERTRDVAVAGTAGAEGTEEKSCCGCVKHKYRDKDSKEYKCLVSRLRRIEGQVRGVCKMVEEDRYCVDISTQLMATQALLARINADVLKAHIEGCVTSAIESGDEDLKAAKLAEIERVVDKLSK